MKIIDLNPLGFQADAVNGLGVVCRQAQKNLGALEDKLLSLRLNFGKLRAAIEAAFAPITAALAPVLNEAMAWLTDFFNNVGAVLSALLGTVYKKTVTTTRAVGGAVRRTIAHFDQINRLEGGSGGGVSDRVVTLEPMNDALTPQLRTVVERIRDFLAYLKTLGEKIRTLLAPVLAIDLTPALQALGRLGQTIAQLGVLIGQNLEWAWFNVLVPLAKWVIEAAVPASVDVLREAFSALCAILGPVLQGIQQLLPALKPVAAFLGQTLLLTIQSLGTQFGKLAQVFASHAPQIAQIFTNLTQIISQVWTLAEPVLLQLRDLWLYLLDQLGTGIADWVADMIPVLLTLTEFIANVLAGDWTAAFDSLKSILKGTLNGIIGLVNTLLSGLATSLNTLSAILNKWSVQIPDWVPLMGGKTFGFRIPTVTAPQIPYLAQGAVLPANRPFLAMVGDQRHGTNIEAPLSTIQEAVALAMQDLAAGNMAGHEATVEMLRQILAAVLGIRIGDETITAAVDRCHARQAIMKGGRYAP